MRAWHALVVALLLAGLAWYAYTHVQSGVSPPRLGGRRAANPPPTTPAEPTTAATSSVESNATVARGGGAGRIGRGSGAPSVTVTPRPQTGWRGGHHCPGPGCWKNAGRLVHPTRLPPVCGACHAPPEPDELLVVPGPSRPSVAFNATVVAVEGPIAVLQASNGTIIHAVRLPVLCSVEPGDRVEATGLLVMKLANSTRWELIRVQECRVTSNPGS